MPYTPPSHRSPASSASASPDVSRRSSFQSGSRPSLPRSASYLSKHRRTPSVSAVSDGSSRPLTPQGTEEDLPAMAALAPAASVRQSPPPLTDERGMPKGAVISPPESASSGSDDEGPEIRGRKNGRLQELRDAVGQISNPRTPSPTGEAVKDEPRREPTPSAMRISFSTSALGDLPTSSHAPRKHSHVRSATEPNTGILKSADNSLSVSEEDTDEDLRTKPQMVRKKSGELVRPALRPSSRRRPSSMPGTPVFSKAVHFDSHLEHVRHFLQVDRPLAVSAGSSPVDNYDSDNEYPFPSEQKPGVRTPPFEWELLTPNFPHDTEARKASPVRLEKLWMSSDQKCLLGSVAVTNLAFNKSVLCRFTLDYWKTTSEVAAEYSHEIRPRETPLGCDRFTFSIKLADTANLEAKTLFFCIRYTVNGQDYWDNNSMANFQVDFRKKHLPMNGKNNYQGAASRPLNGLPRSNRRQNPSSALRPKSMPVTFDDFGDDSKLNFDQSIHEYLGESEPTGGLRLKTKSAGNLGSDNIAKGLSSPSGVAFANRYDFGASLSAAVQAAKDSMGRDKDALYMKTNPRRMPPALTTASRDAVVSTSAGPSGTGTDSPTTGLPSSSYEELVNKYCFFGSKQTSPTMKDGTLQDGRFDGPGGDESSATGSTNSLVGSPSLGRQHAGTAASHTIHLHGSNPYFHQVAIGASPAVSPPTNTGSQASTPKALGGMRAASPAYSAVAGPSPSETSYHNQQRALRERFPWAGDAHAATAIRG